MNGGLLSVGGFGDPRAKDREQRQTWWLAPGASKWVRRADMGRERAFFGSACIEGVVYAIGESVERYDFASDKWSEVAPAGRLPRSHFGAAALGTELFVLGGYGASEAALFVVDTVRGTLRSEPPPPDLRQGDHFHLVHALRNELHVVGGLDAESFAPSRKHWVRGSEGWREAPAPPAPLWAKFCAHAVVGDSLYVFEQHKAWRYDAALESWKPTTPLGIQIVMPGVAPASAGLLVIGGMQVDKPEARLLMRFTSVPEEWIWMSAGPK